MKKQAWKIIWMLFILSPPWIQKHFINLSNCNAYKINKFSIKRHIFTPCELEKCIFLHHPRTQAISDLSAVLWDHMKALQWHARWTFDVSALLGFVVCVSRDKNVDKYPWLKSSILLIFLYLNLVQKENAIPPRNFRTVVDRISSVQDMPLGAEFPFNPSWIFWMTNIRSFSWHLKRGLEKPRFLFAACQLTDPKIKVTQTHG